MIKLLVRLALITMTIALVGICCTPKPLPWVERNNIFYTNDIVRAQAEIPFTIITPKYIPRIHGDIRFPAITGTLKKYQGDGKAGIELIYLTEFKNESLVIIHEYNYPVLPLDPELNPRLEVINEYDHEIVRSIMDFDSYFYFNSNGVYYVLHFQFVPLEEAEKVVESMLKQL